MNTAEILTKAREAFENRGAKGWTDAIAAALDELERLEDLAVASEDQFDERDRRIAQLEAALREAHSPGCFTPDKSPLKGCCQRSDLFRAALSPTNPEEKNDGLHLLRPRPLHQPGVSAVPDVERNAGRSAGTTSERTQGAPPDETLASPDSDSGRQEVSYPEDSESKAKEYLYRAAPEAKPLSKTQLRTLKAQGVEVAKPGDSLETENERLRGALVDSQALGPAPEAKPAESPHHQLLDVIFNGTKPAKCEHSFGEAVGGPCLKCGRRPQTEAAPEEEDCTDHFWRCSYCDLELADFKPTEVARHNKGCLRSEDSDEECTCEGIYDEVRDLRTQLEAANARVTQLQRIHEGKDYDLEAWLDWSSEAAALRARVQELERDFQTSKDFGHEFVTALAAERAAREKAERERDEANARARAEVSAACNADARTREVEAERDAAIRERDELQQECETINRLHDKAVEGFDFANEKRCAAESERDALAKRLEEAEGLLRDSPTFVEGPKHPNRGAYTEWEIAKRAYLDAKGGGQ